MTRPSVFLLMIVICVLGVATSGSGQSPGDGVIPVDSPAGPGSGEPNLFAAEDGTVYLSWIEPAGEADDAFRFARLEAQAWSEPRTIATGSDWFVNWADVPSLVALGDGTLVAHWLVESGGDTYAYDVQLAFSHDRGQSWPVRVVPHHDGTRTEHGFVTMMPWRRDQLLAIWLDGRNFASPVDEAGNSLLDERGKPVRGSEEMTLRFARIARDGKILEEAELDGRTCDCCPTSVARTGEGAVAVYRDRSEEEIRDISFVRYDGTRWSAPERVHADDWEIPGCPVNGPAVDARERSLVVAWFTDARDSARVNVIFAAEGSQAGRPRSLAWDEAFQIDDGKPLGRVDVVLLEDGSALVSWLEQVGDEAEVRVRRIWPDGRHEASRRVAVSSAGRASGMPRMVRAREGVVFAWTRAGQPPQVLTARMPVP